MNRISTFMTMLIPLLFAGSMVMAPSATAAPPETSGSAMAASLDTFGPAPDFPFLPDLSHLTSLSLESVLAAWAGSVGALPSPAGDFARVPGLQRLTPDPLEAVRGENTGSADALPRIIGNLLRLLELVRQVPLPLPPH
jgi:hypothetical protein